jgi:uncharacterized protein YodC (DUF2158 family)
VKARSTPLGVGDVVMLRSGGPRMTVFAIASTAPPDGSASIEVALCSWFHGDEVRSHGFPAACLAVVEAVEDRAVN